MNRIQQLFKDRTQKLIPYITSGFPELNQTVDIVKAAEKASADMVELGMPFSDPLADGPIIQQSSQIAIKNGVSTMWILDLVKTIRKSSEIPIALMGYINPIMNYGLEKFLDDCQIAGVDGLIIPDLPPEEADTFITFAKEKQILPILLVAPNTSNRRIKKISELAGGLIYCVAILGITGTSKADKKELENYLERVAENCSTPFVVGFGIKSRGDVRHINRYAHAAVVGSELILRQSEAKNPIDTTFEFISELKGLK